MFSSEKWFGGGADNFYSHTIDQSLRFEDGDNPYLSKTLSGSGGTIFTFSCWIKLGNLSINRQLLQGYSDGNNFAQILLYSGNYIGMYSATSGTARLFAYTQALQRDPTAWYNIVVKFNGTSSSEEFKIYVNGENQTLTTTTALSAHQSNIGNSNAHYVGNNFNQSQDMDGYMAEVNFIDGTALDADSFGETKAGIWIPKDTSGLTFGTNGFRLKFQDSSELGDDTSGNGNDFIVTNLASTDQVLDSPTNNWATMNPLDGNGPTISEGNLKVFGDTSYSVFEGFKGTFPMSSGKWYWEVYIDVGGFTQTGITPTTNTAVISTTNLSYHTDAMTYESNGNKAIGTGGTGTAPSGRTATSYGASYTDGDIIGVALDLDSSTTTLTFYKNNSSQGTAFSSLASDEYVAVHTGIQNNFGVFNFGQDSSFAGTKTSGSAGASDANGVGDFYYTPPSGFLALCTANLPNPGIDPAEDEEPADNFNTILYTGNGSSSRSLTGVGFQPDWVWLKDRSAGYQHSLFDSVRGTGANKKLYSSLSEAEGGANSVYGHITSFDSDGFSVATGTSGAQHVNHNTVTYVAWNWLAGGSASSNTDGSITSSVSANTEAGFSIVSYTGNATAGATVGHGLSSTPEVYIVKSRSLGTSWVTYHKDASSTPEDGYLVLNGTDAFFDTVVWNDTAPTSSLFSLGGTGYSSNNSGATYIAYCFHSVEGYSKFGSYTGNGSSDGPFVYTGFRPALVIVKNSTGTESWGIGDSIRSPINPANDRLYPNLSNAEYSTGDWIDLVSNGFKSRGTAFNTSSATYIYLAFAEQPFKYSNAR